MIPGLVSVRPGISLGVSGVLPESSAMRRLNDIHMKGAEICRKY